MNGRRGFTLLELMVVVAIVALLATMAIPMLGRFRARAQLTACGRNQGQIAAAMMSYANESRNYNELPQHRSDSGSGEPDRWWGYDSVGRADPDDNIPVADIFDFVDGEEEVFKCPGAADIFEFTPADVSYGYNAWFLGRAGVGVSSVSAGGVTVKPMDPCRAGMVDNASDMIVVGDSTEGTGATQAGYLMWYPNIMSDAANGVAARHGKKGAVGFLDGSARGFDVDDINPTSDDPRLYYWDPRKGDH